MRGNKLLGIIFANTHDGRIRELTDTRAMASVPFGGRYRLIDFTLSSMVDSGINNVGVITKNNYQSLMDHLGSGKAWDLSRKRDGLFILPPFGNGDSAIGGCKVDAIASNESFLKRTKEDYVIITDSDIILNIEMDKVLDAHIENEADITVVYKNGEVPACMGEKLILELDGEKNVTDILINPDNQGVCNYGLRMYLMKKSFLMDAVKEAVHHNRRSFTKDIIASRINSGKVLGYEHKGYCAVINSMEQYFNASMDMLNGDIRQELFLERPVYTKVRDEMPAVYGLGSVAKNSLVADGCTIDGEVENCILFRGVTVAKGAKIKNCIVMQDSVIGANSELNYVILDKNVQVGEGKNLIGDAKYPMHIKKDANVD